MSEQVSELDLDRINQAIADRSNVFYWQTDRAVEPEEAGKIWADRHSYFSDEEIMTCVNEVLEGDSLVSIVPHDPEHQTNLGNVSSVRSASLESGREVVIRCFPKGVKNGYFHVEALAAKAARNAGIPSYETLAIHDFTQGNDFAFHVIEKLPGFAIKKWLEDHPDDENLLLPKIGKMMAMLHQINVDGFGPFDNERAKNGEMIGLHQALNEAVLAGLPFNLDVLQRESLFSQGQSKKLLELFSNNHLLEVAKAVLVHNDFADWNLLTDGNDITGVLDWDECVAGDPIADIACWSTFFEPERLDKFLDGYWQTATKPVNFEDKFELLRLRYTISKMTLRLRRYGWDPSDEVKHKIEVGRAHLAKSMEYFGL